MKIKDYIPGLSIVLIIAFISYYISTIHASFDALVISIIIGMLLGNVIVKRQYLEKGIELSIRIFLPIGIAMYGSQLVFSDLKLHFVLIIFIVFSGLFGLTFFVSKVFGLNKKLSILLASGLSICGASAIAVISPLIDSKREDTSISIISVMMLGLTGMIFYPILNDFLSLSTDEFSFLAGTTLPMLGQVKVVAGNVGQECLAMALKIKLIRISFLLFLVTIAIFLSGKEKRRVKIPWFIVVFILFSVMVNLTGVFLPVTAYFKGLSTFFLSACLAAIGFSVDFNSIIEKGITPLAVIFASWGVIILIMFILMSLF
jgi:uncharacterized integral membrane protein (TIGR00698 family)